MPKTTTDVLPSPDLNAREALMHALDRLKETRAALEQATAAAKAAAEAHQAALKDATACHASFSESISDLLPAAARLRVS